MRRREFIGLIGGAAVALPLAARAQQAKQVRRIGVLMVYAESDQVFQGWVGSFRDGLAKHGWIAGHNLHIEYRWAGGDSGQLPGLAAELVALMPDAIFAIGSPTVAALQRTTRTVPVVFANVADPVGAGFVGSLARPGGNITGFAIPEHDALTTKRLELLKQIAPGITRVIVIYDPSSPVWSIFWIAIKEAAPSLDIKISAAQFAARLRFRLPSMDLRGSQMSV